MNKDIIRLRNAKLKRIKELFEMYPIAKLRLKNYEKDKEELYNTLSSKKISDSPKGKNNIMVSEYERIEKRREQLEIEYSRFKYTVIEVEELMEKLSQEEKAIIELVYTNKIPGYDKKQIGALFGMSTQQLNGYINKIIIRLSTMWW